MDRRSFLKTGAPSLARLHCLASQRRRKRRRTSSASAMRSPCPARSARVPKSNTISQYKLWQKRVNDAGGISLKKFNKKVPIELIAYDDRGQPDELIKLTERLVLQDKVDMS